MTPLLLIWYGAGLFIALLIALEARRAGREARAAGRPLPWRRILVSFALPAALGAALFAIWPLVAWALATSTPP